MTDLWSEEEGRDQLAEGGLSETELDELIVLWAEQEEELEVPNIQASDLLALPLMERSSAESTPASSSRATVLPQDVVGGRRSSSATALYVGAALAAGLTLFAFGGWKLGSFSSPTQSETQQLPLEGWKAVRGESSTRIALQFSIERTTPSGAFVEPGRAGAAYGADDALILRIDLRGEPSWVYLFEQSPGESPVLLHPQGESGWQLAPGLHALASGEGKTLAYRPDRPARQIRYFALASSDALRGTDLLEGVLEVGLDRPDRWPQAVRAVDSFVIDWLE